MSRHSKVNEVLNALSVYSQVQVIGQVKEPTALPYHEGMTVPRRCWARRA